MGRHLGIDFLWFLVDFWRQVGQENGAKIDPRRHRKSDGKVDSVKIAKKLQQAVTTLSRLPSGAAEGWGVILRLSVHPGALLFSIVFSTPFWIDLGSILLPNLASKIHQNPRKIDAKMPSHLDFIF